MYIYIYQDSKLLASFIQWYNHFPPGGYGAEIKCTVHVALPKWPISQFKLDQKSRQQVLRSYCFNIYCGQRHKTTKRNSKHTNFNLQLHSLIYRLDRQSSRSINQNLFIHCLVYIYSTHNLHSPVWLQHLYIGD